MRRLMLACALVGVCLVSSERPSLAGVYGDLVKGDDSTRSAAALTILKNLDSHAQSVIRRAILVASVLPDAKHLPPLSNIVMKDTLSAITRGSAALALGIIGHEHPELWPPGNGKPNVHRPLPVFAKKVLAECLDETEPITLRRMCAEAVGMAELYENMSALQQILNDEGEDDLLRIAAGRALTRITGQRKAPNPDTIGK